MLPLTGDRKPVPFLKTEFNEDGGRFSPAPDPQGRLWLAYSSDETGRSEIYLRPFTPGAPDGAKTRVSTSGGSAAQWRKDGRELFYLTVRDGKVTLLGVDLRLGATPEIGAEHRLFDMPPRFGGYAPFADGQRFLFIEPVGEPPAAKINVVLNWTAELKR
jgi:Tol biopolymer transport system component